MPVITKGLHLFILQPSGVVSVSWKHLHCFYYLCTQENAHDYDFGFMLSELVQCLLSHGAQVNRPDSTGKTPLIYACGVPNLNFEAVQLLLANGAEPDVKDDVGLTPLLYTLLSPNYAFETVRTLLSLKARLDVFTPDGKAPIHLVIQSQNPE